MRLDAKPIVGVDLFCGAGGLTYGLRRAGVKIVAGYDVDRACEFPFRANNVGAEFVLKDVATLTGAEVKRLYPKGSVRLLAGCAPCAPFSSHRRGSKSPKDPEWRLLGEFTRLVRMVRPELVTMENVPRLASKAIFRKLLATLEELKYQTDWQSVHCPRFGIPQRRRRLVLVASRLGPVAVPKGDIAPEEFMTVRDAIEDLARVRAGKQARGDRLHRARAVTPINRKRLKASLPGGTWRDWPKELRAKCHRARTGASYRSVYARMAWDEPAPTITTQAYSFGTGRFGHPEQNRSITLREAAILQSFPPRYRFVPSRDDVYLATVSRLIGNAVPPVLACAIGKELMRASAARRHRAS